MNGAPVTLLSVSVAVLIAGGALAAAFARSPRVSSWVGAGAPVLASLLGVVSVTRTLLGAPSGSIRLAWQIPGGGIVLASDPLSAFFLVPVFVLGGVAALYGREYLSSHYRERSLGVSWLAYNVLLASMVVLLTARHALLFLVAWEVMSLSSFVLIVFEHERSEVQRAGWIFLIAAHLGMALLIAAFLVLDSGTGTFLFDAGPNRLGSSERSFILLLSLVGFGTKAGLVPLHVWLPEAHAAAPSHVSALMSGVVIKMGLYGIVRMTLLTGPPPAAWGQLLVTIGLFGGLYGISMASAQRDMKRAFAYSSIENIGLIAMGLGLGYWGMASGHPILGAFGFWGALLHVWNHAAMKGLMFLGAGAVVHATGTKDLERLGGLMKRTPVVGVLLVLGSLAISGLPPLNGFVSEWLLYRSLLDGAARNSAGASVLCALALGGLALVGALAALCYLRVCSIALLGQPRSSEAATAHDMGRPMLVPMGVLLVACLISAFCPATLARALASVVGELAPAFRSSARPVVDALSSVGYGTRALGLVLLLAAIVVVRANRRAAAPSALTWDCGYAAPTTRMQYTARSFGQLLADLVPAPLKPAVRVHRPQGLFPARGDFATRTEDPFTDKFYEPAILRTGHRMARVRWLQQGAVHIYLLYILVALAAGLAWTSLGNSWG